LFAECVLIGQDQNFIIVQPANVAVEDQGKRNAPLKENLLGQRLGHQRHGRIELDRSERMQHGGVRHDASACQIALVAVKEADVFLRLGCERGSIRIHRPHVTEVEVVIGHGLSQQQMGR